MSGEKLVQNQVDPENEEVLSLPVTTFKNHLVVCSLDQDTDAEIRSITITVGSISSYGQRSSITSSESSIGGDNITVEDALLKRFIPTTLHSTSDYCPHSTPWYGSEFICPSSPYEMQGMYGYNYSPYGSQFQLPQVSSAHEESSPFLVKLKKNRIKKCRGCNREFSRKVDGCPPDPPLNLVICHEERRPYRDAPKLSTECLHHANHSCIRSNHPSFAVHEVQIPTVVELSSARKYLRKHFGCQY